ncbi:MAG: radical SAM protein [Vulcanimicrobiota bacterium]
MASPRFIGRKEYFGSLFYDFDRGDYIPFDWDATHIFELSEENSLDEIAEKIKTRISKESFLTFVQLCQSIELFDKQGRLTGSFLPHMPVQNRLSAPLKVHLQLTTKCNLNCRHCSQDTVEAARNELKVDEIYKLIDEMCSIGTYELVLGGGDPFVREKDVLRIVKYATQKNVSVYLSTNALTIGRVFAKKLADYPVRGIRISFDGSTEKSFDYQRGKGSYRRVVRSIKTLRELFKCPITLHTVLMKTNFTEILSFMKAVQKYKCNAWSVDFVKSIGQAKDKDNLLLSPEELKESLQSIQKLQKYSSTPIELRHFPYKSTGKRVYRGFGCVGGNLNCWIDSTGNVYPCSFLREKFHAGNIREQSLKDIWLYSANLELFRNLSGNETCRECSFFDSCRGGCRARALEAGDMEAIDPACFICVKGEAMKK